MSDKWYNAAIKQKALELICQGKGNLLESHRLAIENCNIYHNQNDFLNSGFWGQVAVEIENKITTLLAGGIR